MKTPKGQKGSTKSPGPVRRCKSPTESSKIVITLSYIAVIASAGTLTTLVISLVLFVYKATYVNTRNAPDHVMLSVRTYKPDFFSSVIVNV